MIRRLSRPQAARRLDVGTATLADSLPLVPQPEERPIPEMPTYPPDVAICRLLVGGPLPTTTIVDRLDMPERTARHRLHQLRRWGVVVTGDDGLHRLAGLAGPNLAGLAGPEIASLAGLAGPEITGLSGPEITAPASDTSAGKAGGLGTVIAVLAVLAVVGIGLAAVALARTIRPDPPQKPPTPYGHAAGWYQGPAW